MNTLYKDSAEDTTFLQPLTIEDLPLKSYPASLNFQRYSIFLLFY
jgi:hypothetical protein